MRTLYDLTDSYLALLEMADDPELDEQALADTLEGIQGEFFDKAEGYAKVLKELSAREKALTAEIQRLQSMKSSIKRTQQKLKDVLTESMQVTGNTKFKTDLFSFWIAKNPKSLVLNVRPEELPVQFQRITVTENADLITQYLKAGNESPYFKLESKGESVRFR